MRLRSCKQGAFTHALLAGLRRQGEGNWATVERLDNYLQQTVPGLTDRYKKVQQTPRAEVDPASKYHLILLPRQANDADVNQLRVDAFRAQFQGELQQAKDLWVRVLINAPGDRDAVEAIGQIAVALANGGSANSDRRGKPPVVAPNPQGRNALPPNPQDQPALPPNPQGRHGGATPTTHWVHQSATPKAPKPQSSVLTYPFEFVQLDDTGQIAQRQRGEAAYFSEELGNGVTLEMTAIPGGSFKMGGTERSNELPTHNVTVQPFYMGKVVVTQAQWARVASLPKVKAKLDPDPAHFKGSDRPVEQVSWRDAIEFCARLSQHTGKPYRLPSEAEWEYACRAGTTTHYHFGDVMSAEVASYDASETWNGSPKGNYRTQTMSVQTFPANLWGLYEMHGNVWEWCADYGHCNYDGAPIDGDAWTKTWDSNLRILRGGSWGIVPRYCRSARRTFNTPGFRSYGIGFRVVCRAPGLS